MNLTERVSLAILTVVVATMPVFALRPRRRDPEVAGRPATVLLGHWVRDWCMWLIGPVESLLVRARVAPDAMNYLGVAFGAAAGLAFARGAAAVAGWMILLGGVCDILDGRLARRYGVVSQYGAFLDSTLDRFAETFAFLGLCWYFAGRPWPVVAAAAAMAASLLVSYTRARGEALGVHGTGGVMQRAERLVVLALAALTDNAVAVRAGWPAGRVLVVALGVIAAGAFATAIYRTAATARALRARGPVG